VNNDKRGTFADLPYEKRVDMLKEMMRPRKPAKREEIPRRKWKPLMKSRPAPVQRQAADGAQGKAAKRRLKQMARKNPAPPEQSAADSSNVHRAERQDLAQAVDVYSGYGKPFCPVRFLTFDEASEIPPHVWEVGPGGSATLEELKGDASGLARRLGEQEFIDAMTRTLHEQGMAVALVTSDEEGKLTSKAIPHHDIYEPAMRVVTPCKPSEHEFRPIDSSGQRACLWCDEPEQREP
jgi:hypothetical protein